MGAYVRDVSEIPYLEDLSESDEEYLVPGLGRVKRRKGRNKFLGQDPEKGPLEQCMSLKR